MDKAPTRLEALVRSLAERDVTPSPERVLQERAESLRQMRADYSRKLRSGALKLLEPDPVTGKRPRGTGRAPRSGWLTPHLKHDPAPVADNTWRFRSRRERANELRERMAAHAGIYNAAWLVRDAYFGADARRQRAVKAMLLLLLLAACGPIQVRPDAGRYFTIEHGTARFQDAYEGARQHCAAMGMDVRHLGTDRAQFMLSRFECIPR